MSSCMKMIGARESSSYRLKECFGTSDCIARNHWHTAWCVGMSRTHLNTNSLVEDSEAGRESQFYDTFRKESGLLQTPFRLCQAVNNQSSSDCWV